MATLEPVGLTDSERWYSGDSRELRFRVTEDETDRDITDDDLSWMLLERPFESFDDAVIDETTDGVEIVTDPITDPSMGEFIVRVDEDVTADLWGRFYQVAIDDGPLETRQSWRGEVLLEALNGPN